MCNSACLERKVHRALLDPVRQTDGHRWKDDPSCSSRKSWPIGKEAHCPPCAFTKDRPRAIRHLPSYSHDRKEDHGCSIYKFAWAVQNCVSGRRIERYLTQSNESDMEKAIAAGADQLGIGNCFLLPNTVLCRRVELTQNCQDSLSCWSQAKQKHR